MVKAGQRRSSPSLHCSPEHLGTGPVPAANGSSPSPALVLLRSVPVLCSVLAELYRGSFKTMMNQNTHSSSFTGWKECSHLPSVKRSRYSRNK